MRGPTGPGDGIDPAETGDVAPVRALPTHAYPGMREPEGREPSGCPWGPITAVHTRPNSKTRRNHNTLSTIDRSLQRLLDALPEGERKDPKRRAQVARTFYRLRREREARRLKSAEPGQSGAGIGSVLDLSDPDYRRYRTSFRRSWDFTPWKVKRYKHIPISQMFGAEDVDALDQLDWIDWEHNRADVMADRTVEERTTFDTPVGRLTEEEMGQRAAVVLALMPPDLAAVLVAYGNTYDPRKIGGQKFSIREAARAVGMSKNTFARRLEEARRIARTAIRGR